jgi:hypothetical protein
MRRLRPRLTYANVVSTLCLFILLGGTAWAVAANSVGTAQLKNGAVTKPKLAGDSVDGSKVVDKSLTDADINVDTLSGSERWHHFGNAASSDCGSDANVGRAFCIAGAGDNYSQWGDSSYVGNYGYGDPAYYRDRDGTVHLRGLAACKDHGSSTWCSDNRFTLFYLPPGYRPHGLMAFETLAGTGSGSGDHYINIFPDGRVRADGSPPLKSSFISLDGLSFRCYPQGSNGCN